MLSRELEETLRRAMSAASSHNHEFATLEHLLLALTEDSDAIEVLSACKVDIDELRARVSDYIENELASIVSPTSGVDVQPTASFQRVIQRAIIHTQSSGREVASGANVLSGVARRKIPKPIPPRPRDRTRLASMPSIWWRRPPPAASTR